MLRMFLVVLAWPLAVLLIASAWTWYLAANPEEPPDLLLRPAQQRGAQQTAAAAMDRLRSLPPAEQQRLVDELQQQVVAVPGWLQGLAANHERVICLGEHHEPATRRFLASTFFPVYPVDVLLLEVTPAELDRIERWQAEGRDYVPLLDADIGVVLEAVRQHSPAVRVRGIEETPAQVQAREGRDGSRDRSLVRNFWRDWQAGQRHVILYGALHCTDDPGWLYHHLRQQMPPREDVPMRNVRVVGDGQHEGTRAFVLFLESLDLGREWFAIADAGGIPAPVRRWFATVDQQILQRYRSVLVFQQAPDTLAVANTQGHSEPVANAPGSADALPQWVSAD